MTQKQKSKKPSELLNLYSQKLTSGIESRLSHLSFELTFRYRSPHVAHISGYVIFRSGWVLEFDEIIKQEATKVAKIKYRYHLMDRAKELILRYDNVPHFPKLKTYPHHKHTETDVIESNTPELLTVIEEIELLIIIKKKLKEKE